MGANVPPGPAGSSGGLRTRPGYVPGPAGTTPGGDSYRVGARAPWGILLDDRPAPEPGPAPVDPQAPQQGGPERVTPGQAPVPPPALNGGPGGGAIILAGDRPALAPRTIPVTRPVPPGQAKKLDAGTTPPRALPAAVSFASLLSVLPPAPAVNDPEADEGKPTGADDQSDAQASEGEQPENSQNGTSQDRKSQEKNPEDSSEGTAEATQTGSQPVRPGVKPTPEPVEPSVDVPVPSSAPEVPSSGPTPAPSATQPAPDSTPTAQKPAPKPKPTPALPATGWRTDGLRLAEPSADATGKGGSAAFRKALKASLGQRPTGDRPAPAALRAWSASLAKAAALAPDPRTKEQLRRVARYTARLAGTPAAKRTELQQDRPGAIRAAKELRISLPKRFGIDVLG